MRRFGWTLCALLLTVGFQAHAETQLDLNFAAAREAHRSDLELDGVYRRLQRRANSFTKHRLYVVQEHWRHFRQQECNFETAFYEGGSIAPLIYWNCYARMTRARIAELKGAPERSVKTSGQLSQRTSVVTSRTSLAMAMAMAMESSRPRPSSRPRQPRRSRPACRVSPTGTQRPATADWTCAR